MGKTSIVIGGNHHNTTGLVRSLGRKGIHSVLILHNSNPNADLFVLRSKYVCKSIVVKNNEEIVTALFGLKKEGEKQVVFCTSDVAASAIDLNRDELSAFFYLPCTTIQGRLTKLMNKDVMADLALKCGLNIPVSFVLDHTESALTTVPYPCITKPIMSIKGSKADIKICSNEGELKKYLEKNQSEAIQVQKYIDKAAEYQLIGLCCSGEVIIPGKSIILTQSICSNTGYLKYVELDGTEPIEECMKFLKETGFSGLFSMEFLRDKVGNDYFMEINFRNDGNAISVTEAGINLPWLWYLYCTQGSISFNSESEKIREVYICPELSELRFWIKGEISFRRMWKEIRQADSYMDFASDDPAPTHGWLDFYKLLTTYLVSKYCPFIFKLAKWLKRK